MCDLNNILIAHRRFGETPMCGYLKKKTKKKQPAPFLYLKTIPAFHIPTNADMETREIWREVRAKRIGVFV